MQSVCPYCESDETDDSVDYADGVCGECGFVLRESREDQIDQPQPTVSASDVLQDNSITDWRDEVTIRDSSDENLVRLVDRTEKLGEDMNLDDPGIGYAVEHATEAWTEGLTHGRSIGVVAAAAVQIGARQDGFGIPSRVVAENVSLDNSTLVRTRRAIIDQLDIEFHPPRANAYLPFIASELEIEEIHVKEAENRLKKLDEKPTGNPSGIAAAAIYLELDSSATDITFRGVADIVALTKETVWTRAQDLRKLEAR